MAVASTHDGNTFAMSVALCLRRLAGHSHQRTIQELAQHHQSHCVYEDWQDIRLLRTALHPYDPRGY